MAIFSELDITRILRSCAGAAVLVWKPGESSQVLRKISLFRQAFIVSTLSSVAQHAEDAAMRKLTPELLDHLPHGDPGALRSRQDLRRINFFMGNERWIASLIPEGTRHITEIGAGDGQLLCQLARKHPQAEITAYDLAPRPAHLPLSVKWTQGDIFTQTPPSHGGTLIANLFLHHFTDPQLADLGAWIRNFDTLIINEPLRARLPLLLGKLATPFIHPITRHDMRVSIEAGFAPGELAATLALAQHGFVLREITDWRGAIRIACQRRN